MKIGVVARNRTGTFKLRLFGAFALAFLAACGTPSTHPNVGPAPLAATNWIMYQGAVDHNAIVSAHLDTQWTTDIGDRTNGGLAVAGSSIFLDTFGQRAMALDLRTGAILWQTTLDGIVMSTPIVAGGLVYIGTGRNELGNTRLWARSGGDRIVALDAATGSERWSFKTRGEDMPSPAYAGGVVVFANGDAHAYGLRSTTGKLVWSRLLPGIATMASAQVIDRDVLVSICTDRFAGGMTLRLRAATGDVVWKAPFGNCDSTPTVGAGRVYVSGDEGLVQAFGFGGRGVVAALDAASGRAIWVYRSPVLGYDVSAGSAERAIAGTFHDGTYYQSLPGEDRLIAFDAADGAIRWSVRTLAPVKMSPLVIRNRLLAGDGAGLLYTIDTANGHVLQTHMSRDGFSTSPLILVGRTLIFNNGRSVIATPLIHYWGAKIEPVPELLAP